MKRIATLFLFALLTISTSCGTITFPDVWAALQHCDNIDWSLATRVFGDLVEVVQGNPAGDADLATLLAADTVGAIPCLLDYFHAQGGETGKAAAKMKAVHAPEIRAARARGGAVSMKCPGDPTPKSAPAPRPFAYSGPNPGASLAHCYRQCGDNVDALAPPGGCECYRKVGGTWRWVAAR